MYIIENSSFEKRVKEYKSESEGQKSRVQIHKKIRSGIE